MTKRGHKNSHNDLTHEFVREVFNYDPETGELCWKKRLSTCVHIGDEAGCLDDQGRIKIGIQGRDYFAHRIIWLWMTGIWPIFEIDHIDEIKSNNRWTNLRHATSSENHRNRGAQKNNTSGYKGVTHDRRRGCWIAGIKLDGYRHNLGSFSTAEEAYKAYCNAALILHGPEWAKF